MFRRDYFNHCDQELKRFNILVNVALPADIVHVAKIDRNFFTDEKVGVLIVAVEIVFCSSAYFFYDKFGSASVHEATDDLRHARHITVDTFHRFQKRKDRTFHALQKVNAHQTADADFTPFTEIFGFILVQIFVQFTRLNK